LVESDFALWMAYVRSLDVPVPAPPLYSSHYIPLTAHRLSAQPSLSAIDPQAQAQELRRRRYAQRASQFKQGAITKAENIRRNQFLSEQKRRRRLARAAAQSKDRR
jgi:hypothetical protein